jgi:hypothetical protein
MQSRRFSGLPVIGILAVIYFVAGELGLMLASLHASASPVWPSAGLALAQTVPSAAQRDRKSLINSKTSSRIAKSSLL